MPELSEFDVVLGSGLGGTTPTGVVYPDGALILNPSRPIPGPVDSFGMMKVRYRTVPAACR